MFRRTFLATSSLAAMAATGAAAAEGDKVNSQQQYLEWRKFILPTGSQKDVTGQFLKNALIPALGRLEIGPVGVFTVMYGQNEPTLYVLIPYPDLESMVSLNSKLVQDEEFMKAGEAFINAPFDNPAYVRMESSLLLAFSGMPKVETPVKDVGSRIFELRTYESHNKMKNIKKIEMFNEGGEIEVFRQTGLHPVFFGETLIGQRMPNLVYMLAFENMAQRDANWKTFGGSPEWKKLSGDPQYKDTVSNITDIILRPTDYSQI